LVMMNFGCEFCDYLMLHEYTLEPLNELMFRYLPQGLLLRTFLRPFTKWDYRKHIYQIDLVINWNQVKGDFLCRHLRITNGLNQETLVDISRIAPIVMNDNRPKKKKAFNYSPQARLFFGVQRFMTGFKYKLSTNQRVPV